MTGTPEERRDSIHATCDRLAALDVPEDVLAPIRSWADALVRLAAHPCPAGDECALGRGAVTCFYCGRNWPPDETWERPEPTERDPRRTGEAA